ncbi:origin recognition complex subunit 5 C-terminus-domain-containing protein, partial [Clohesyomyces aquaticus]
MLPDELLAQLNTQFPCRELQLRQLSALYSPDLPSPPLLVVHGLTATGKTSVVKNYFSHSGLPHAIISSRECITGRHLLERTVSSCLDALDSHNDEVNDRRAYSRTENINALAINLQRLLEGRGKFVLVFDGIDKQREAPSTLLPALARLGESIPNLSIVLISTLPLTTLLHRPGTAHLHFPTYSRSSLLTILSLHPPKIFPTPPSAEQFSDYTPDLAEEDDAWLWNRFLGATYDSLSKHAGRDLVSFQHTAHRIWPDFVKPVVEGQFGTRDFSRLMVNRRSLFMIEDAILDRIISASTSASGNHPQNTITNSLTNGIAVPATPSTSKKRGAELRSMHHDLPYYTKHLLISAYLASYNPSRTDTTYFMKHTDKRKNRRKVYSTTSSSTKHRRIPRHLLTPSPFPLDRVLAIFRSLVVTDEVGGGLPQTADIGTQIATLASLRLLVKVGGVGAGDVLEP